MKFLSVHRRERLVELGWREVPFLHANGVTSWDQLKIVANSEGLENVFSESGWCNNPVAVADSKLCEVDEHFLECVAGIRENSEISTRIDCFPLEDGSSRKYQDLHCIATDLNTDSAASSLTIRDLMSLTAPKNLIVVKQDAIVSNGCWWTDGHIEVGGGDSISYTPLGSKLFLI